MIELLMKSVHKQLISTLNSLCFLIEFPIKCGHKTFVSTLN